MLKSERLLYITGVIRDKGVITIREIMDACGVSDMTARRDLGELEKEGRLTRIHGGAQGLDFSLDHELSHEEKTSHEGAEKFQIALRAAQLVHDEDIVFMGPGTTVEALAEQLKGKDVYVVTTSHPVFMTLCNDPVAKVFLVGGEYRGKTRSFVGELTCEQVRSFTFGKAFIGCNGIHANNIMSYSPAEGVIQKAALDNSQYRYLLADHTKFNRMDFYTYCHLQDFDLCVTDAGIDPELRAAAEGYVTVEVAKARGAA